MLRTVFIASALASCAHPEPAAPAVAPQPNDSADRACIQRFVDEEQLPLVHEVRSFPVASGVEVVFEVDYGKANDCPSGCFTSHAFGVMRDCNHIGWVAISDYDVTDVKRLRHYPIAPDDPLLEPATGDEIARFAPQLRDVLARRRASLH